MDDTAVVAFCRQVHPGLVAALTLQCGSRDVAEELAQETLVRVWERWDRVQSADSPEAWTFRVAFNFANSWWRRQQAERRARQRAGVRPTVADADLGDAMAVRDALAQLPPRQRSALILRYFADLGVQDTATAMGCAPGTVKALCSQGIANMRRRLGPSAITEEKASA
jgi:RNA polymerase sigma-70 factor (sigma-E family)